MNVAQAARHYDVARSTIYRWIKRGKIKAERRGRRWFVFPKESGRAMADRAVGGPVAPAPGGGRSPAPSAAPAPEAPMQWPSQVHRETAMADGLTPDDFRFDRWPISDLRLRLPDYNDPSRAALVYECAMAADTPEANKYVEQADGYTKIPDPVGIALSSVEFELRDADTGIALDVRRSGHMEGRVQGFLTGKRARIWQRLTPGESVRVKLHACPWFYYLAPDGAGRLDYASTPHGYMLGEALESVVHTLAMDQDGNITIDGSGAEPDPEPEHTGMDEWEAAQEADRKRQETEARDLMNAMRGNFDDDRIWLLAMHGDANLKAMPQWEETCRKVAAELGIEL